MPTRIVLVLVATIAMMFVLMGTSAWAAGHATTYVGPLSIGKDSRCWPPFLKQALPDILINSGSATSYNFRDYYAVGDVNVTDSPECGDVDPTFTAGGTITPGFTLDQADKNDVAYGGTASGGTANNTYTVKFTNSSDAVTGFTTSIDWSVTGAGVSDPQPVAGSKCVAANGNDTASGSCGIGDAYAPWKTVGKINGYAFTTGTDVYFRAGDTFAGATLVVDWSGTALNRVVIGSYYRSGNQSYELQPDDATLLPEDFTYSNGVRANINGSYDLACGTNCAVDGTFNDLVTPGLSVPSNRDSGMVKVAGNYVTIRDISVTESAGRGISTDWPYTNGVVQRVYLNRIATVPIMFYGSAYNHALSNLTDQVQLCYRYNRPHCSNWGGTIVTSGAGHKGYSAYSLIENNTILNTSGEGILQIRSNYGLVRANRISNARSTYIYLDGASNVVIEDNVLAGDPLNTYQLARNQNGIGIGSEGTASDSSGTGAGSTNAIDNLVRNNLLSGMSTCFGMAVGVDAQTAGVKTSAKYIGNTCANPVPSTGSYVSFSTMNFTDLYSGTDFKNNIFTGLAGAPCSIPSTATGVTLDYNLWSTATSAKCTGAHDVIDTDPEFTSAFNFALSGFGGTGQGFPDPATDGKLGASSPALNVGSLQSGDNQTAIDNAALGALVTFPNTVYDQKYNLKDYNGNSRSSPADMGWQER